MDSEQTKPALSSAAPAATPAATPAAPPATRLALLEWLDGQGRVLRSQAVQAWPLSLGRAWTSDAVLDDAHAAEHHARIEADEQGSLTLKVLATKNGAVLGGQHHASGSSALMSATSGVLQLGQTRLRLRLPGEVLPAERALSQAAPRQQNSDAQPWPWRVLPWLLPLLALEWARLAISLDPGADTRVWLPRVFDLAAVLLPWCGAWALLSKLFQQRFDFMGHLAIAGPWYLAIELVEALVPQVAAALGWPWLWHLAAPLGLGLGALLVRAHLVHVLPDHRRAVHAGVLAMVVVGAVLSLNNIYRSNDRLTQAPYMSTLPMTPWFVAPTAGSTTDSLVKDMAALEPGLAARTEKARQEDRVNGEPDSSAEPDPD